MPPPGSSDDAPVERRQHSRKNVIESQLVSVELAPSDGGAGSAVPRRRGIVIDLSQGGLAVQPFLPVSPGSTSKIELELPGSHARFEGTGTVAWVGPGGRAGIRFLHVAEPARHELERALASDNSGADYLAEISPPIETREAPDANALDFEGALQLIVERARAITAASGAAIAVGDSNGMICRATIGNAPDVGVPLLPGSGLSGLCLHTGEMVQCTDAENDRRIDAAAARRLKIRSALVVPIFVRGALRGLVEVFSPRPQAFEPRHTTRLLRIAELLSLALEEAETAPDSNVTTAAPDTAADGRKRKWFFRML